MSIRNLFMFLFALANFSVGAQQYTLKGSMSTYSIFTLNPNGKFGIKGNFSGKECKVEIRSDPGNYLLYGAKATGNFGTYQEGFWSVTPWYGYTSDQVKSSDYATPALNIADVLNEYFLGAGSDFYYSDKIPVTIEITFTNSSLTDLIELYLPGIGVLDRGDFVNCSNNPSIVGCNALRDWKNVSDPANQLPMVVAHRGFHGDRATPENSYKAVKKAVDSKFRFVEVDIRMTIDDIPFLFHDDLLGYATNSTNIRTPTELFRWDQIEDFKYKNRYQEDSGELLTAFFDIVKYIKGHDMMLFLDIKSHPMERNLEVMAKCIQIAAANGVLHQIGFKMVRTNLPATHPSALNMTLQNVQDILDPVSWIRLMNNGNIHVVDYDPSINKDFIQDWIGVGNVLGLELDFSKSPFYQNPSMLKMSDLDGMSPLQYYKNSGLRVGLWSSTAADCRGRPGHDPAHWGAERPLTFVDNRARLDFMSQISPQYITHDRPDIVQNYLVDVSKSNVNSMLK